MLPIDKYSKKIKLLFLSLLTLVIVVTFPLLTGFIADSAEINLAQDTKFNPHNLLERGLEFYQSEQFLDATQVWEKAALGFVKENNQLGEALTLIHLSLAYQHLEIWDKAERAIANSFKRLKNIPHQDDLIYKSILAKAENARGRLLWMQGNLPQALEFWQQAALHYAQAKDSSGIIIAKINQTKALQGLGLSRQAQQILEEVDRDLEKQPDSDLKATGLRNLGNAWRKVGDLTNSQQILQKSLLITRTNINKSLVLLELGNTERALGEEAIALGRENIAQIYMNLALEYYKDAFNLGQENVKLDAKLNQLSLLIETGQRRKAIALLPEIDNLLPLLAKNRNEINAKLSLVRSLICLQPNLDLELFNCATKFKQIAAEETLETKQIRNWSVITAKLTDILQDTQRLGELRFQSYGLGYLAQVYQILGQSQDAKTLNQLALQQSESIVAPEISYLWEWQLGRLAEKEGNISEATAYYTSAVETLTSVRRDLVSINPEAQFSFRDRVEPVYRGLINLLLTTTDEKQPNLANLQQAIETIDDLQLAEIENFLGCNLIQQGKLAQIQDPKATIIYPIILENRLVSILQIPDRPLVYQETIVAQTEVEKTLKKLRHDLTIASNTPEVLESSEKLYNWLFKPLETLLKNTPQIETLVFVLDGSLRNIPMAVLYDGQEYLIEKGYGIAIAPRLQLFNPHPSSERLKVKIGGIGLAQVVEGISFSPIEKLNEELDLVSQQVQAKTPLVNEDFTRANIQKQLESEDFSAIHWKTHGIFSSVPEQTYILAYNERIKAQDLNQLIQTSSRGGAQPLDLLVLSACETAKGDERAVLGLAGIAVRTGSRSVLSTFWVAQDAPNTELMGRFYQELAQPGVTKAEALRRSQLALLQEYGYTTPHIWGTYVLVGNWL